MRAKRFCVISFAILLLISTGLLAADKKLDAQPARPHQGKEPEQIEFGIYVLDIDEISGQNQNFAANFFLLLRWKDERLAHSGPFAHMLPLEQVWAPPVLLTNRQARVRTPLPKIVEVEPDGTVTYRQQYVGPLSQRLRLHDFPLDTQTFSIHFALPGIKLNAL